MLKKEGAKIMQKTKIFLNGLCMMAFHAMGFAVFGIVLAMLMKLPNNMFSGILTWPIMLCVYYCASDDKTRELINKLMRGKTTD